MKLWIDTEFNEYRGALISLALVAEDGREWYDVKNLKDEGHIVAVIPGIFEAVETRPDRAVSGTWTEDELGRTVYKLEVGDHCLDLSPRETRHVALLTGGVLAVGR